MSKRLISRLSIILLSSLMVIQSCQTPNNVKTPNTNSSFISNKSSFSIKTGNCTTGDVIGNDWSTNGTTFIQKAYQDGGYCNCSVYSETTATLSSPLTFGTSVSFNGTTKLVIDYGGGCINTSNAPVSGNITVTNDGIIQGYFSPNPVLYTTSGNCFDVTSVITFSSFSGSMICPSQTPYPSPTPTILPTLPPTPTSSPNDCDSLPPLLPEDINNLLQKLGQYLLPNALSPLTGKVNNFTNNVNSANNLAGQYGFSTQATKEEKAKVKYDDFVEKINQSKQELLTESSNLKTVASNILNEVKTKSNINKQLLSKETDFNSYKLKVEELVDEFNYLVTDENTYSLAEASAVYGQEIGLLAEIIEDYANRVLPVKISNEEELEQYQDDENGFEKIQTTKGLIRYLKARIEGQKTRLDKANTKLSETLDFLKAKSLIEKEDFYKYLNELESESEKLENILEQLNNDLEDTFKTQGFKISARDQVGIEKFHSAMEKKQKKIEENRQWLRDNIPPLGFAVDQILDPVNLIPLPQAKVTKTTKAIASPLFEKFFGPLAKQTWESLGGKKGYAYATEGFNKASDSLFSMGSKGKKFDKAVKPVQNTSNKVTDTCKVSKCKIKLLPATKNMKNKVPISVVADDWVGKGAHVHISDLKNKEVFIKVDSFGNLVVNGGPGKSNNNNNVVTKEAVEYIKEAVRDPDWRAEMVKNCQEVIQNIENGVPSYIGYASAKNGQSKKDLNSIISAMENFQQNGLNVLKGI